MILIAKIQCTCWKKLLIALDWWCLCALFTIRRDVTGAEKAKTIKLSKFVDSSTAILGTLVFCWHQQKACDVPGAFSLLFSVNFVDAKWNTLSRTRTRWATYLPALLSPTSAPSRFQICPWKKDMLPLLDSLRAQNGMSDGLVIFHRDSYILFCVEWWMQKVESGSYIIDNSTESGSFLALSSTMSRWAYWRTFCCCTFRKANIYWLLWCHTWQYICRVGRIGLGLEHRWFWRTCIV